MAVTLKTIAEKANVSVMAVSSALNGAVSARISASKKEHIRKIAAELGYKPNVLARRLSGGASRLIGVIADSYLHNSSSRMLRGIEVAANKADYRVLIAEQHESVNSLSEIFRVFEQYGVDGVICISHDYSGTEEEVRKLLCNIKNLVLWEAFPDTDIPYVAFDVTDAVRTLVNGWKAVGRTRAAIVLNADFNRQMTSRAALFTGLCKEAGLEAEIVSIEADPDDRNISVCMQAALAKDILPRKIDCILAENDIWACGLMGAAAKAGIKIPEDIAIAGWDDEIFCCSLVPQLASISIRAEEIGHKLVEIFVNLVEHKKAESVVVPAEFYCRESCGFNSSQ